MFYRFEQISLRRAALRGLLLVAVATSTLSPRAIAATLSPPERAETYTFAFHDADISQVSAEILGKALGLTYTIDPGVTGKLSFQIDRKLTGPQLLEAFEVVLEDNEVSLVREGDALAVKPRSKAKASATIRTLSDGIHGAGYQTLAVPLDFAAPTEIAKALQAVTSKDLVVYTDDKLGLLVLGGDQTELQSAIQTVHLFDQSGFANGKIRFFDLQQAAAQTVASDLNRIIEASQIAGVSVVPLKRLNGLFAVSQSPAALNELGNWIRKLDVPSREKTLSLWVYHPRNLSADTLSTALNGVMGIQTSPGLAGATTPLPAPAVAAGSSATVPTARASNLQGSGSATNLSSDDDPVRIGVDKQSNTLLFSASQAHWVQIQRTLNELDRTPSQVLIEASILEVTLSNQLNYGVDWSVIGAGGRLNVSNINSASGTVAQAIPGFSATFLDKNIQTAISALSQQTRVEVISAPKIVAIDNHEAKLEVGDSVPITTQSQQSTNSAGSPIVNSVDYKNTGIILTVTPRIGGDGHVMLDISQEVSSVSQTTSSDIDSPTIQERKVTTTLMLSDGGVVALGGLISSNKNIADQGIPLLQNIPFAGNLFKTRTSTIDKTELVVLITAKVIPDQTSANKMTADLLADMKEIRARGLVTH